MKKQIKIENLCKEKIFKILRDSGLASSLNHIDFNTCKDVREAALS